MIRHMSGCKVANSTGAYIAMTVEQKDVNYKTVQVDH